MCRRGEALSLALFAAGAGLLLGVLLPGCTCELILGVLLIVAGIAARRCR